MDRDKNKKPIEQVAARIKSISRPISISSKVGDEDNSCNKSESFVNVSISPEKIPSVVVQEKNISTSPKRVIIEKCPTIGGIFNNIQYVQPDPLPAHIEYLLKSGMKGLDFVKIPTEPKTDRLYLQNAVYALMKLCGINWDDLEEAINIYNDKEEIPENLKRQGYNKKKMQKVLHAMFTVSKYYADRHDIEFLV